MGNSISQKQKVVYHIDFQLDSPEHFKQGLPLRVSLDQWSMTVDLASLLTRCVTSGLSGLTLVVNMVKSCEKEACKGKVSGKNKLCDKCTKGESAAAA